MLKLDSGNFSDNPTPEGDAKTKGLLQAMERLGYKVVNVGERDVRMGYAEFLRRIEGAPFDFVSANIVRQDTQEPIFKPYVIVDAISRDGSSKRRVGVVGVVRFNPIFLKSGPDKSNMVIDRPAERVRAAVEQLKNEGVDVIVLLAALHKNDAAKLAAEIEGIDYVLGSYGGVYSRGEERHGDASVLYCGNRGQRVIETRVFLQEKQNNVSRVHYLSHEYESDQAMLDFVRELEISAAQASSAPAEKAVGGAGSQPDS